MNYERTRKALMAALDCPSVENRLTATIALEDHSETMQLRIDELEAVLHKLATSPWAPQRVVDMAREVLGSEEPRDGYAWSGGFASNH